jgi:hypothetical protein
MTYNLNYKSPYKDWGSALTYVEVDKDGKMWIGNGEYSSQVNFCPFTGTPAPLQMKVIDYESKLGHRYKLYENVEHESALKKSLTEESDS